MRADRISCDLGNWSASNNQQSRVSGVQTPRNRNNNGKGNDLFRRSISPLRQINDRVISSPLRVPLEQAISKCVKDKSNDRSASRRTLGKSNRQ